MGLLRFLSLPVDDFWFSAILLILVRPFLGCRAHLGRFVLHDFDACIWLFLEILEGCKGTIGVLLIRLNWAS